MPRFFFHTINGSKQRDTEGIVLKDTLTARREAIRVGGSILADDPDVIWDGHDFRILVTDEEGKLIVTVVMLAVDADAVN